MSPKSWSKKPTANTAIWPASPATLLLASELVVEDGGDYIINPVATALVSDLILNSSHFVPPTEESEYESYWNTMEHGVFDVLNSTNQSLYSAFYPNLIK